MAVLQTLLSSTVTNLILSGAAAGVIIHQILRRVFIDLYPLTTVTIVIGTHWVLLSAIHRYGEYNLWEANQRAFSLVCSTLASLATNILVYRAFFHRLRNFPGPFGARLSKFWAVWQTIKSKARYYQVTQRLHQEYGDYVRTADPAAIQLVHGLKATVKKGPFYAQLTDSVHTTDDPIFHKERRKIWDFAMKESLVDYGPIVEEFTTVLHAQIDKSLGQPVSANALTKHYSYDVISTLGFGNSTRFLEGESTEVAKRVFGAIERGVVAIGLLLHVPYLLTVMETFTYHGPMGGFNLWAAEEVQRRKKVGNPRPDLLGHLLKNTKEDAIGRELLDNEARMIIGAGSDPAASSLAVLLILLAENPEYQVKLREEIDQAFENNTYACGKHLPLLDGIINESLRLYPSVIFQNQRLTPPEGLTIGSVYIPGDTIICLGPYQQGRDKRNFVDPDEFIPERWTTQPELILNRTGFFPFSLGHYNCVGKTVAMMELRSVVARTVKDYDISFPAGVKFDGKEFFSRIIDHFSTGVPRQDVVFTKRHA
ncbi:hypothetical protein UA08_09188 [Talaromyces atroroseus]|uniref:Tryprostatin B 6-hydroxylase n=1 Tax=Talaromyces atroroseus TaxID=1441469 RepID=A0A1Q5Q6L2_TALAT|nr:hypothetical protein UA08_09188 [Talaromyces atroroseus]OKL55488.1 hypothetical protein UA08_09188 [Talaromyces atroroseus]